MFPLAHVRGDHATDAGLAVDQQSRPLWRAIQGASILVLVRCHPMGAGLSDLGSEGVRVALEDLGDGLLADALILDIVAAAIAIAVLAVLAAREAFAVELQTPRVLAIAILLGVRLLARWRSEPDLTGVVLRKVLGLEERVEVACSLWVIHYRDLV